MRWVLLILLLALAATAWARHPLGGLGIGLPGPIHRPATTPVFGEADALLLQTGTDALLLEGGTDRLLLQ